VLSDLSVLVFTALQCFSSTSASTMQDGHNLNPQAATERALLYAYPLLAFQEKYTSLVPKIGVNCLGHMLRLATSQARSTVKPNADTVYSTALYDISQHSLQIDLPAVPADQYALFSFHDLYGNNFAVIGQEDLTNATSFILTHEAASQTFAGSQVKRVISPTTFGTVLVRWLFKDGNLDTIHSLQNATTMKATPLQTQAQANNARDNPMLTSIDWSDSSPSPPQNALRLLCQVGAVNTPGCLAGATVQEILQLSGFRAHKYTLSKVDIEAADRNVLAELKSAGQNALEQRNNGWSVIQNDIAGDFSDNYGLRAQIAFTGYLMLQAPAALYPSWSGNGSGLPLEGQLLELGAHDSYVYTFSGRPPLGKLGFWSLTVYDADGYLIHNPRNVSSLGDRSNITYPSGDLIYGPASSAERDEAFQLLVQPADIPPPANWMSNWLPGPSGGGNMTALLRFYNATEELLDGRYQFPTVSKQSCIIQN